MNKKFLLVLFSLLNSLLFAQEQKIVYSTQDYKKENPNDSVYAWETVHQKPVFPIFPGGEKAFFDYIDKNLKYPNLESEIKFKIVADFIVNKNGEIKNIEVFKSAYNEIDQSLFELLKKMPKWKSGKHKSKPVAVKYNLSKEYDIQKTSVLIVDQMPVFPGGESEMFKYINKNKKIPVDKIKGKVDITFAIDSSGTVKDVKILKGLREDIDQSAIELIKNMPHWEPGRQRGKAVETQYRLPIEYK